MKLSILLHVEVNKRQWCFLTLVFNEMSLYGLNRTPPAAPYTKFIAEALNLTWLYLEIVFRKVINFNLDFKNDVLIL